MTFDPAEVLPPSPPHGPRDPRGHGRDLRHAWHHHHHQHHHGHGVVPGLVLVAWGGLLLLRELGYLSPALRPLDFWPLVLIGLGLSMAFRSMAFRRRRLGGFVLGLAVAALGAGLLAEKLGYRVGAASYWPVLLIAAGVGVIWNGLTRRRDPRFTGARVTGDPSSDEQVSGDELHRAVSMGGLTLVVESQQFRGGSLSVTMGEIKADLRRAAMAGDTATLDLSMTMGGIELSLPSNWLVVNDLSPFMGTVEDRTEPRPDSAGVQKKLILRGSITMGAVTIRS